MKRKAFEYFEYDPDNHSINGACAIAGAMVLLIALAGLVIAW